MLIATRISLQHAKPSNIIVVMKFTMLYIRELWQSSKKVFRKRIIVTGVHATT